MDLQKDSRRVLYGRTCGNDDKVRAWKKHWIPDQVSFLNYQFSGQNAEKGLSLKI